MVFYVQYFQISQWQKQQQRGKDSTEQEGMQTQREGKINSGVSVRGGKGTHRQGKRKKKSNLGDRAKRHKRKMWRDAKKRQKNREALRNSDTPPQSPDNQNAEQPRSGSSRSVVRS